MSNIPKNINNVIAINITTSNLVTSNFSSTNATFNSIALTNTTIPNLVSTNLSSGSLNVTNISTGTLNAVSGLTTGNINFTGGLFQNGVAYVGSQWTSTSGNVSYTSGNVIVSGLVSTSNLISTTATVPNVVSTNISTGTLNAVSGLTTGNINFTGGLFQNGVAYVGSQWTSTSGNVSYTSGNVIVGGLISTNNLISTTATIASLISTNVVSTNNSTGTINASTGITSAALLVTGLASISNLSATTSTIPNIIHTNISTGTINVTGITSTNVLISGLASISNLSSTTSTIPSLMTTNISTGTINASTGITSNSLVVTSLASMANLFSTTATLGNLITTNISTGAINASTGITGGTLRITGDAVIVGNFSAGNYFINLFTAGNVITNNVNYGVSNTYSGSFAAANNVSAAAAITNLQFNSVATGSFTINLNVNIITSPTTGNLMSYNILEGYYTNSGWTLLTNTSGDASGIVFTINSSTGQINYTSTNVTNWVSNTFRYRVSSITINGTYNSLLNPTQASYSLNSIQLNNTSIAVAGSNTGALYTLGGITVGQNLQVYSTTDSTAVGSGGSLTILGGAAISKNLVVGTGLSVGSVNSTGLTTGNINFTGGLFQNGVAYVGSQWTSTSGNVSYTSGNVIIGGLASISNLIATSSTVVNLVNTNISTGTINVSAGITSAALLVTGLASVANLSATTSTVVNLVNTNISTGTINVSTGITSAALLVTGLASVANLSATTSTVVNLVNTNISTGTINVSAGITSAALLVTGLASVANLSATTSTVVNLVNTNISTGTINVSAGITSAALLVTGLASVANLSATTSTIPNIIHTNISTGTINVSTGITSAALLVTGVASIANLSATTSTIPNIIHTNISTGTIIAATSSITNLILTSGSIGSLSTGNISVSGNMTVGGNLLVQGSLISVNITAVNVINTTISTGTLISTNGITSGGLLVTTGNITVSGSLLATNNSNTLGNLYTTGGNLGIGLVNPIASSLLTINGGNLISNKTQASIAFGLATTPGYYHFISSRHNAAATLNALDIWLNTSASQTASTSPGFGNSIGMSIVSTGVGILTSNPAYALDVAGSTRIVNTTATSMGTLIVAGPNSGVPATTTSGQLASFYGAGGASSISNIDLSTFIPTSSAMSLPSARISMFDLGSNNSSFNILTKNAGTLGTMASRIMIDGSGNVGINTSNPAYTLDVNGTSRFTSNVNIQTNNVANVTGLVVNNFDVNLVIGNIANSNNGGTINVYSGGALGTVGASAYGLYLQNNSGNLSLGTTGSLIYMYGNVQGITSSALLISGLASIANLFSTTATIPSLMTTNITTSSLMATSTILSKAGAGGIQISPTVNGAESTVSFWTNTAQTGNIWVMGHNPSAAGNGTFAIYNGSRGSNVLTLTTQGNVTVSGTFSSGTISINTTTVNSSSIGTLYLSTRMNSTGNILNANTAGSILTNIDVKVMNKRQRTSRANATRAVSTFTVRNMAATGTWYDIAWSAELGLFATVSNAVGTNQVQTSPDGITWTARATSATNGYWSGIVWVAELGLFVIVSNNGGAAAVNLVMTSSDGITWTQRTVTSTVNLLGIVWSPELSLLVASSYTGNYVITSSDGTTWSAQISTGSRAIYRMCWSPELSLFVGTELGGNISYSTNGTTWTNTAVSGSWLGVCWSPELYLFAAVSSTGSTTPIATSPDGINWTLRTVPTSSAMSGIVWAPELSLFVATGYVNVFTSSDGINWTTRYSSFSTNSYVAWSPELSSLCFVQGGSSGAITTGPALPNSRSSVLANPTQLNVNYSTGNVGIGLNSPNARLHIYESTGTNPSGNAGSLVIQRGNTGGSSSIVFPSTINNGSDYGYIQYIDNVGATGYTGFNYFYGAITPGSETSALVIGCENDSGAGSGPDSVIISPAGNVAITPRNNVTYISGNVGINTTAPGAAFDVSGTENWGMIRAAPTTAGGIASIGFFYDKTFTTSTAATIGNWVMGTGFTGLGSSNFSIYRNGGNGGWFNISSSGNVGIGTTSPGGLLQVASAMLMTSSGTLTVTGDVLAFGTISDQRLKTNVQNVSGALDTIKALRPVTFDWRQDIFNKQKAGTSDSGFIAQEVADIIPHAIGEYKDIESGDTFMNLRHERFNPYIVGAIQELVAKVNALEAEIAILKNK